MRSYQLKRRAERQEETRQRIVEATVALHEAGGGAAATISAIAARAGVERHTVYRHFPDELSLLTACTTHYSALHPLPDPAPWAEIADLETRVRTGLIAIYCYHRETEQLSTSLMRDLHDPSPVMLKVLVPYFAYWRHVQDVLAAGWEAEGKSDALVPAAVGHAISFATWKSLVREQGLDDAQAIELMVGMVRCIVDAAPDAS
jgi:AcrR family transcriptional regulator